MTMSPFGTSQILMAPIGADVDDRNAWTATRYLSTDGIQVETRETLGDLGDPIRTDITHVKRSVTFTMSKASRRVWLNLVSGIYRLPGGKPLIHKGRKP